MLTDNSTSYVELDPTDQMVKVNTTGFTAGRIPLRQVTTVSGSQSVSTDRRGFVVGSQLFYEEGLVRDLDMGAGGKLKAIRETWQSVSITSGAVTFDLSQANNFHVTLNANITSITFSNMPATGNGTPIVIELTQDATGGRTVAGWPAAVKWPGGTAPTITATAHAVDVIAGYVRDGTNIRLGVSMQDGK